MSARAPHPANDRLRRAIADFEVSHPDLTHLMQQVLNTLSGAGI